jgi:hypothetical protein
MAWRFQIFDGHGEDGERERQQAEREGWQRLRFSSNSYALPPREGFSVGMWRPFQDMLVCAVSNAGRVVLDADACDSWFSEAGWFAVFSPDGRWAVSEAECNHTGDCYSPVLNRLCEFGGRTLLDRHDCIWGADTPHRAVRIVSRRTRAARPRHERVWFAPNGRALCIGDNARRVEYRLFGEVEEAALATLGSLAWRELWRRDGDSAIWARVLSFV